MNKMEKCIFCDKDLSDGRSTIAHSERRSSSENQANEKRGSAIRTQRVKESISNVGNCLQVKSSFHARPRNNIIKVSVSKVCGKGQD